MLTAFFCEGPVTDLASAQASDLDRFSSFHQAMRAGGVSLPPSQFETAFVSTAHSDDDIDRTIEVASAALRSL